jgi:hypothetical protein
LSLLWKAAERRESESNAAEAAAKEKEKESDEIHIKREETADPAQHQQIMHDGDAETLPVTKNTKKKQEQPSPSAASVWAGTTVPVSYPNPKNFAERLMHVMEAEMAPDSIWWVSDGKAVALHPKRLKKGTILKSHFQANKYSSFLRNFNRWGFRRVPYKYGLVPDGAVVYQNSLFQKDQPHLVKHMRMDSDVQDVFERHQGSSSKPAETPRVAATVPIPTSQALTSQQQLPPPDDNSSRSSIKEQMASFLQGNAPAGESSGTQLQQGQQNNVMQQLLATLQPPQVPSAPVASALPTMPQPHASPANGAQLDPSTLTAFLQALQFNQGQQKPQPQPQVQPPVQVIPQAPQQQTSNNSSTNAMQVALLQRLMSLSQDYLSKPTTNVGMNDAALRAILQLLLVLGPQEVKAAAAASASNVAAAAASNTASSANSNVPSNMAMQQILSQFASSQNSSLGATANAGNLQQQGNVAAALPTSNNGPPRVPLMASLHSLQSASNQGGGGTQPGSSSAYEQNARILQQLLTQAGAQQQNQLPPQQPQPQQPTVQQPKSPQLGSLFPSPIQSSQQQQLPLPPAQTPGAQSNDALLDLVTMMLQMQRSQRTGS